MRIRPIIRQLRGAGSSQSSGRAIPLPAPGDPLSTLLLKFPRYLLLLLLALPQAATTQEEPLIAFDLGYYFATTVDWDYLNQGANISVLSRFPIKELHVQEDSPFQNVGVKVAISRTQDMHVMSNWYGMDRFPSVFEFHQARFQESDIIPTLFAGDFNAIPHTDGGDSPASLALLEAGFTDAFRSLYPDVQEHPGASHRSGRRIDQLYYKGAGLRNTSTRVISTRPGGFPSDHFLILSTFDLDYSTLRGGR